MKKKLLLQDLSDYIAQHEGISKKEADAFVRAFFEVIEQGLLEDKFVKIKGLGTFKLVAVSERESVNINTGERFQISGHTKISFTPDSNMKELVNRPFAHFETVDLSDDTDVTEFENIDQKQTEENLPLPLTEESNGTEDADELQDGEDYTPDTHSGETQQEEELQPTATQTTARPNEPVTEEADETEQEDDIKTDEPKPLPLDEGEEETSDEEKAHTTLVTVDNEAESEQNQEDNTSTEKNQDTTLPATADKQHGTAQSVQSESRPATPGEDGRPAGSTESAEEDIVVTTPQTINPHSETDENQTGSASTTLNYSYHEVPMPRKRNHWKTLALTILVILLTISAYFIGYFRFLCPCSYPIIEGLFMEKTMPAQTQVQVPPPNQTPAPAEPASRQPLSQTAAGQPAADTTAQQPAVSQSGTPPAGKEQKADRKEEAKEAAGEAQPQAATAAPSSPQSGQNPASPRTHIIQRGDNLLKISRKYYGSEKHVRAIMKRNGIKDPDNITLGAKLILP